MTLKVSSFPSALMRLFNSRRAALVVAGLKELESMCDELSRRVRYPGILVGPNSPAVSKAPNDSEWDQIVSCLKETQELCEESDWEAARNKVLLISDHLKYTK